MQRRSLNLLIACGTLVAAFSLMAGCGSKSDRATLRIAVAANVQYAIPDIIDAFESESGIRVEYVIGSSGNLTAQIKQGAPFDVLLSADMRYPQELKRAGFGLNEPQAYAMGILVLVDNTKNAQLDTLEAPAIIRLLENADRIAIANPELAPYGVAAKEVLVNLGVWAESLDKLVYGESISQVNQFITTKAVQVGFTAKSATSGLARLTENTWHELPAALYSPIAQGAVIVKREGQDVNAANDFFQFLYTGTVRDILISHGYRPTGMYE